MLHLANHLSCSFLLQYLLPALITRPVPPRILATKIQICVPWRYHESYPPSLRPGRKKRQNKSNSSDIIDVRVRKHTKLLMRAETKFFWISRQWRKRWFTATSRTLLQFSRVFGMNSKKPQYVLEKEVIFKMWESSIGLFFPGLLIKPSGKVRKDINIVPISKVFHPQTSAWFISSHMLNMSTLFKLHPSSGASGAWLSFACARFFFPFLLSLYWPSFLVLK